MSKRNYVVIARFDDTTTQKLHDLRLQLRKKGIIDKPSEWPPHITIAAYEGVDIESLLQWTEDFTGRHAAFGIMLSALGVFPPRGKLSKTAVLYAAPSQSKELVDFYYAFHERLDEFCGDLGWLYSAKHGHPVMHSTIGSCGIRKLNKTAKMILSRQIFGNAKFTALEVYTYPMELIRRFDLVS